MYLAAGEFIKAVEIMGQNGWVERYVLIDVQCTVTTIVLYYCTFNSYVHAVQQVNVLYTQLSIHCA